MKKYCVLVVNNLRCNEKRFDVIETNNNNFARFHDLMKTGKIFGFGIYCSNDNFYELYNSYGNLAFMFNLYNEDIDYFKNA